ncbi:MAG: DUF2935 domain-containing protein [Clostridiales bacterium]|nr:DUF2935 domain-containing protein [Clostridiales bacterium]
MTREQYITDAVELNMFYSRILKEHCALDAAGLPPPVMRFVQSFERYKVHFEMLLGECLEIISHLPAAAREAGEMVTDNTAKCENKMRELYGVSENPRITALQAESISKPSAVPVGRLPIIYEHAVKLNGKGAELAKGLTELTQTVSESLRTGQAAAAFYPAECTHQILEAEQYLAGLRLLEKGGAVYGYNVSAVRFWTERHKEHALVMRGDLDPSETADISLANGFAREFNAALAVLDGENGLDALVGTAERFADYLNTLVDRQLSVKVLTRMPVLQADHILRETNYLLRIAGIKG